MSDDFTTPEAAVRDVLDNIGVGWTDEYPIGNQPTEVGKTKHRPFHADFYIASTDPENDTDFEFAVEVEGEYNHADAGDGEVPPDGEMNVRQRDSAYKDVRKSDRYRREGYRHVRIPGNAANHSPEEVERRLREVFAGEREVGGEWLIHPTSEYSQEPDE